MISHTTSSKPFTGQGVALVTPFMADGSLDYGALRRITAYLIESEGVDFLVPMGTTGESATLTEEEFSAAVDTILTENNGRLPVLLGCGGNDTAVVARKMGLYGRRFLVQGFLSVSPYYNKPTQGGIYAHYRALAEASPLPIILYNVPGRTASNISAETTVRLASDFTNIMGIKEASCNLEQGAQILRDAPSDFITLVGDDALALPAIACGFQGCISVIGNALPAAFGRLVHAALTGDFAQARQIHLALLALMELNFAEGNPAGVKALMHFLGLCEPHVRLPLMPASAELIAAQRSELNMASLAALLPQAVAAQV